MRELRRWISNKLHNVSIRLKPIVLPELKIDEIQNENSNRLKEGTLWEIVTWRDLN